MLKRIITGLVIVASMALFIACGDTNQASTNTTSNDKKQEVKNDSSQSSTSTNTKSALTDTAISITTNTLKGDTLVKDVAIVMSDDKKTINVAIQVNAATNKEKAKSLIDTAVRQLGSNCGGKVPTKDYLGGIWENYDGHIRIFSGEKNIILDGYVTKGGNKITY